MEHAATPLVQVRDLTKRYTAPGGHALTVLRDLELSAMPGEMIAIWINPPTLSTSPLSREMIPPLFISPSSLSGKCRTT